MSEKLSGSWNTPSRVNLHQHDPLINPITPRRAR